MSERAYCQIFTNHALGRALHNCCSRCHGSKLSSSSYEFSCLIFISASAQHLILLQTLAFRLSYLALKARRSVRFIRLNLWWLLLIIQMPVIVVYSSLLLRLAYCKIVVVVWWLYLAVGRQHHSIYGRNVVLIHDILRRLMSLRLTMYNCLMLRYLMSLHLCCGGTNRNIRAVRQLVVIVQKMVAHVRLARMTIARIDLAMLCATCAAQYELKGSIRLLARKYVVIVRAKVVRYIHCRTAIETAASTYMVSAQGNSHILLTNVLHDRHRCLVHYRLIVQLRHVCFHNMQLSNVTYNILRIRSRDVLMLSIFQLEIMLYALRRLVFGALPTLYLLILEVAYRLRWVVLTSNTIDIMRTIVVWVHYTNIRL